MVADHTQTAPKWMPRFWLVLLVVQLTLLGWAMLDIARGTPDTYQNQHLRQALNALTGACLSSSFLFERASYKYAALIAGTVALVGHIAAMN